MRHISREIERLFALLRDKLDNEDKDLVDHLMLLIKHQSVPPPTAADATAFRGASKKRVRPDVAERFEKYRKGLRFTVQSRERGDFVVFSYEAVASLVGCSVSSVRVSLAKGRGIMQRTVFFSDVGVYDVCTITREEKKVFTGD